MARKSACATLTGIFLVAVFVTQCFAVENPTPAKKRTSKSSAIKSSTVKRSSKKTSKTKTTSKTAQARTSKSSKKPAPPRRSAQSQPTASRYKEIQQALADKGYFTGSPDGNWGVESVDSLKRFQHDQNLTEDGKIGSLSLIALGLGPQRVAAAATPAPTQ